jgi:hypothetical protein
VSVVGDGCAWPEAELLHIIPANSNGFGGGLGGAFAIAAVHRCSSDERCNLTAGVKKFAVAKAIEEASPDRRIGETVGKSRRCEAVYSGGVLDRSFDDLVAELRGMGWPATADGEWIVTNRSFGN